MIELAVREIDAHVELFVGAGQRWDLQGRLQGPAGIGPRYEERRIVMGIVHMDQFPEQHHRHFQIMVFREYAQDFLTQVLGMKIQVFVRTAAGVHGNAIVPQMAAVAVHQLQERTGLHEPPDAVRHRRLGHVIGSHGTDPERIFRMLPIHGDVDDGIHAFAGGQHLFVIPYVHGTVDVRFLQRRRQNRVRVSGGAAPRRSFVQGRMDIGQGQSVVPVQGVRRGSAHRTAGPEDDDLADRARSDGRGRRQNLLP